MLIGRNDRLPIMNTYDLSNDKKKRMYDDSNKQTFKCKWPKVLSKNLKRFIRLAIACLVWCGNISNASGSNVKHLENS